MNPSNELENLLKSMFSGSTTCINCRKPKSNPDDLICGLCENTAKRMVNLLEKGIEIEYRDGTKETIKVDSGTKT